MKYFLFFLAFSSAMIACFMLSVGFLIIKDKTEWKEIILGLCMVFFGFGFYLYGAYIFTTILEFWKKTN